MQFFKAKGIPIHDAFACIEIENWGKSLLFDGVAPKRIVVDDVTLPALCGKGLRDVLGNLLYQRGGKRIGHEDQVFVLDLIIDGIPLNNANIGLAACFRPVVGDVLSCNLA
jgi:hypothetical protein